MSQNPNGGNYQPDNPNHPHPQHPPTPETAYGRPASPSSPNQGNPPSPSSPNQDYQQPPYDLNTGYQRVPSSPNQGYPQPQPSYDPNRGYPQSQPAYDPSQGYSPQPQPAYDPNRGYPQPPIGQNLYGNSPVNTPRPNYGIYNSPLTPPPPPIPGPGPNNDYDQNALTEISQRTPEQIHADYLQALKTNVPNTLPVIPDTEPAIKHPKRRPGMIALISVIALILIVGGSILGVVLNTNHQYMLHIEATETAIANTHAQATAQASATAQANAYTQATATAVASTYPFSNTPLLTDPLVDNSQGFNWNNAPNSSCHFSGNAYQTSDNQANSYRGCMAQKTNYADFTFEIEMVIEASDDNALGGLIFRADPTNGKYYGILINDQGTYEIFYSTDNTPDGDMHYLRNGSIPSAIFSTGLGQTNTIAVVARSNQINFYVNQKLVNVSPPLFDSTYTHGQIGVIAGTYGNDANVMYTNARVWKLP